MKRVARFMNRPIRLCARLAMTRRAQSFWGREVSELSEFSELSELSEGSEDSEFSELPGAFWPRLFRGGGQRPFV